MISYFALSGLINAISTIVLGSFVYLKNKRSPVSKTFAAFCLSVASWSFFYFLWLFIGTTKESALFYSTALNMGAIFTPSTFLHFVVVFLGIYEKKKPIIIFGYLFSFVIFLTGFFSLFVTGVRTQGSIEWYPIPGPSYHPFLVMFAGYVIYGWYLMIKTLDKAAGKKNLPVIYILIGSFVGFAGGSTNFLNLYNIPIPPYGNGLVIFIAIFTFLAISKYHLFEIGAILTELLVIIMAGVSLVEALLFQDPGNRLFGLGVFVLFCFLGYLLIRSMQKELEAKDLLEQKVQERTKELQGSNEKLTKTYEELQERQKELEKWYNLTIGRELRMAELKEKIKEIEGKGGK
ncbi:MAG: histidine kinase N-terminal 7TM domain-containing protein [Candidatus Paceibacterota bacterium]|jgi:hypothetical protein